METTIDSAAAVRRLLVRTGFTATDEQVASAAAAGFTTTVDAILGGGGDDPGVRSTPPPDLTPVARPAKGDKTAKMAYAQQTKQQLRMLTTVVAGPDGRRPPGPGPNAARCCGTATGPPPSRRSSWPAAMLAQNETERRLGGGDFGIFARAMVVDPALMVWLDANGNTAKAPNENLGRELMELFTLGHGNYTEEDVRQAALALTGWRIDRVDAAPTAAFAARQHAPGPQTILGVTKDFTADDLVDLFVSKPPNYLATRLWGWLVGPTPPGATSLARIIGRVRARSRPDGHVPRDPDRSGLPRSGQRHREAADRVRRRHVPGTADRAVHAATEHPHDRSDRDGPGAVPAAERGRMADRRGVAHDRQRDGSGGAGGRCGAYR